MRSSVHQESDEKRHLLTRRKTAVQLRDPYTLALSKIIYLFYFCYLVFHECILQHYKEQCVLSTNLVYNGIFVIVYHHIFFGFVVYLFNEVVCIK